MRMGNRGRSISVVGVVAFVTAGICAMAGAHTWDVNEAFSTAGGSIWFIELREPTGGAGEGGVGGQPLSSTTQMVSICILTDGPGCGLTGSTAFRNLLFANPAYVELAAAQGGPAPDQVVNITPFFSTAGDTLRYGPPYDTWATGPVPTDGVNSRNRVGGNLANSPRNWNNVTGSVNAANPPPSAVPDGTGPGTAMTVEKLDPSGSSLRLTFDVNTCHLNYNHQIIFGDRSTLPTVLGGTYFPSGAVCGIGDTSPYTWNSTPDAADGSGLIWWLILVNNNGTTEGSWGIDWAGTEGSERQGPGPNGSSGLCGVTNKDLSNTCGN